MLKKYSHSNTWSSAKSVQCTTFLTLSCPNLALKVFGLKYLAISGSWGPTNYLNFSTTFSYLTSKATTGPLAMCSIIGKYSGKIPL